MTLVNIAAQASKRKKTILFSLCSNRKMCPKAALPSSDHAHFAWWHFCGIISGFVFCCCSVLHWVGICIRKWQAVRRHISFNVCDCLFKFNNYQLNIAICKWIPWTNLYVEIGFASDWIGPLATKNLVWCDTSKCRLYLSGFTRLICPFQKASEPVYLVIPAINT